MNNPSTELLQILADSEARAGAATEGPWVTGSIPWKVWANGGRNTVCECEAVGDAIPVAPGLAVNGGAGEGGCADVGIRSDPQTTSRK
jgi:hypothetical protein